MTHLNHFYWPFYGAQALQLTIVPRVTQVPPNTDSSSIPLGCHPGTYAGSSEFLGTSSVAKHCSVQIPSQKQNTAYDNQMP